MRIFGFKLLSCFLLVWMPFFQISILAQDWDTESSSSDESGTDPFGGDPFGGMINQENNDTQWDLPADSNTESSSFPESQSNFSDHNESNYSNEPETSQESVVQNAIIEGVQITTEQGETPDEKLVSGYFIFRDKPSSYFWEVKRHEKKMVFEFHDTKTGTSPVSSVSESPIKGFKIEESKVDINKDVRGLKPEWRDIIKVVFDLDAVPEIHVNDEFSIVSFSFKWTNDPSKIEKYVVKDNTKKIVLLSSAGVGAVGIGALVYFLVTKSPPEPPLGPVDINDMPIRTLEKD